MMIVQPLFGAFQETVPEGTPANWTRKEELPHVSQSWHDLMCSVSVMVIYNANMESAKRIN